MANGSTSSRKRMQKLVDKVNGPNEPIKMPSKKAAKIDLYPSDKTQYKGVPFKQRHGDKHTDANRETMSHWTNAERQEMDARQTVSMGYPKKQHIFFTAKDMQDFNKKGQMDRYESSDYSSKTPNNPADEKYHKPDYKGTSLDPKNLAYTAKPISKKVERFHKRETKREQRILKKANKK